MNLAQMRSKLVEEVHGRPDVKRQVTDERARQQRQLNAAFAQHCSRAEPLASWREAAVEYLQYSEDVQGRLEWPERARTLVSFGSGDCGQLGHGVSDPPVEEEETSVARPKVVQALRDKSARALAAGGLSNAACVDGELLTWGCADEGALGRDGDENLPAPVRLPLQAVVVTVSLGDCHGACATLGGRVFVWGAYRDKEGKAWFPTTAVASVLPDERPAAPSGPGTVAKSPQLLDGLTNVVGIASGANHTVALNGDGEAFSFGIGEQGQLGRRVDANLKRPNPQAAEDPNQDAQVYDVPMIHRDHLTPRKMDVDRALRNVGCGAYHTLAVSSVGFHVYACGLNQYGQVSSSVASTDNKQLLSPIPALRKIPELTGTHVTSVHGGEHFSLARTVEGILYSWGRSDQCQLGRNDAADRTKAGGFDPVPKRIQGLPPVVHVATGSNHVVACSHDGSVYTWGFGGMNQLGHGRELDEPLPRQLISPLMSNRRAVRASAGGQHSCVLME